MLIIPVGMQWWSFQCSLKEKNKWRLFIAAFPSFLLPRL